MLTVPRIIARVKSLSNRLGWLGLYMGLYGGSIVAVCWLLVHNSIDWQMAAFAATLTMSVYLIDRVKPHDRLHDPADRVAHPQRNLFVTSHVRVLRCLCLAMAIVAAAGGAFIHWALPLLVVGALGGGLIYGTLPRRPWMQRRPKDVLIIKNLAVGAAFAAMILAMLWAGGLQPTDVLPAVGVVFFIAVHIFTDAMICDIDDARADAQFGTSTIVNQINADGTWQLALLLNILAAIWLCAIASAHWIEQKPAIIIAMLLPLCMAVVRKINPTRIRDIVDLKMPIAVCITILLMRLVQESS